MHGRTSMQESSQGVFKRENIGRSQCGIFASAVSDECFGPHTNGAKPLKSRIAMGEDERLELVYALGTVPKIGEAVTRVLSDDPPTSLVSLFVGRVVDGVSRILGTRTWEEEGPPLC